MDGLLAMSMGQQKQLFYTSVSGSASGGVGFFFLSFFFAFLSGRLK